MQFSNIKQLVADDLAQADTLILNELGSDTPLIRLITQRILDSGGKRIRPLVHLLAARAVGQLDDNNLRLAAIIEFLHTATLLHDDVVDDSNMRRGEQTANQVFGNAASVLVGDFLFARAFELMVQLQNWDALQILARATTTIAEGEVLQLSHCHNTAITEDQYHRVIYCKTAKLFEAACQLAALFTKTPSMYETALKDYGMHLGLAFQLVDDVLDYTGTMAATGKNPGDDWTEGKLTLPLIYVLQQGNRAEQATLKNLLQQPLVEALPTINALLHSSGAITYTLTLAQTHAAKAKAAIAHLPTNIYQEALLMLADFTLIRDQ